MKLNLIIFSFLFVVLTQSNAFAGSLPQMDLDFGLQAPPKPKTHTLPYCDEAPQSAKEANLIRRGYCLGDVMSGQPSGVYVIGEDRFDDDFILYIGRIPGLIGASKFLQICKPMGGFLSPDGMVCTIYKKKF